MTEIFIVFLGCCFRVCFTVFLIDSKNIFKEEALKESLFVNFLQTSGLTIIMTFLYGPLLLLSGIVLNIDDSLITVVSGLYFLLWLGLVYFIEVSNSLKYLEKYYEVALIKRSTLISLGVSIVLVILLFALFPLN